MEQARNSKLDNLVEAVSEVRAQMGVLRADEASSLQGAHRIMRDKKLHSYRHAGVELVRVPGEEKLRVRTSGQQTSAETDDEPGAEPAEFDEERQDAVEGDEPLED